MSKLYVTEYADVATLKGGKQAQIPMEPPLAEQVVDFSGGVAVSSAFNAKTQFVRLRADAACSILFSAAGTNAATTNGVLDAGEPEFRAVPLNGGFKVSAIANT